MTGLLMSHHQITCTLPLLQYESLKVTHFLRSLYAFIPLFALNNRHSDEIKLLKHHKYEKDIIFFVVVNDYYAKFGKSWSEENML